MTPSTVARFWAKVALDDDSKCWEWQAAKTDQGYGRLLPSTYGTSKAHRFAYERLRGPIPGGLVIDHLCRNTSCVNPAHLEPVTRHENTLRGLAPLVGGAFNAAKVECPRGHPYTEDNTYRDRQGSRSCKACRTVAAREYQRRRRQRRSVTT